MELNLCLLLGEFFNDGEAAHDSQVKFLLNSVAVEYLTRALLELIAESSDEVGLDAVPFERLHVDLQVLFLFFAALG